MLNRVAPYPPDPPDPPMSTRLRFQDVVTHARSGVEPRDQVGQRHPEAPFILTAARVHERAGPLVPPG